MPESNLTEKPQPPAPNECCESGCDPCVWDIYRAELQKWEQAQQAQQSTQNCSILKPSKP